MKQLITYSLILLLFSSCEKWYTTEDVSHVSYLPEFVLEGGEFVSFLQNDTMEFIDPGATAFSGDEELDVFAFGTVDISTVGVYSIVYYAQNQDKLIEMAQRIIAVTSEEVSSKDLSGTYENSNWSLVESKVRKIHEDGLYECEEIMGYYDLKMPGRFVDLGDNKLVLLNGEGYFGRYAAYEGTYTLSTLGWTVYLLDPPNDGIEVEVLWRKKE
jgi:hypothetical protein